MGLGWWNEEGPETNAVNESPWRVMEDWVKSTHEHQLFSQPTHAVIILQVTSSSLRLMLLGWGQDYSSNWRVKQKDKILFCYFLIIFICRNMFSLYSQHQQSSNNQEWSRKWVEMRLSEMKAVNSSADDGYRCWLSLLASSNFAAYCNLLHSFDLKLYINVCETNEAEGA